MKFNIVSTVLLISCFYTALSAGNSDPADLKSHISINCGSAGAVINGREWIGDKKLKFHALLQMKGVSTCSTSTKALISNNPVIYNTARISDSRFSYSFYLEPGQKILRLHFNPTSYKAFTRFKDFLDIETGQFTLVKNFSASLTARALGVNTFTKEFYISLDENKPLDITFSPSISQAQDKTYAFINGIEIISVPTHLTFFQGPDVGAQVVGRNSLIYVDNSSALELIYRFNVKQSSLSHGDEFDTFGMLGTITKNNANEINSLTWKRLVGIGFRYVIRIHFSELGLQMAETGHVELKVIINEKIVETTKDIINVRKYNGDCRHRDYLVMMKGRKQDGQRDLSVSLQSNNRLMDGYGHLEGFEILKLSNHDNSLANPNPLSPPQDAPTRNIWCLLSVLRLKDTIATVVVIIIALVSITIHKVQQLSKANYQWEENKPSARAERQCRHFSLAEIQSATKNFSDAFFIARGGFGEVYKGLIVIDNGQATVAIKRLKENSSQGQKEFLAEIETLSELRHINLVSLIGYCNEGREMILVYEYMPCGTLDDHLYNFAEDNDNYSPLTWKQRLNICIGAARGIDYLHTGHGVIHRDIKASNILLDENFVAKVSDFGLAKPEDRHKLESHVSTNVKGTFGYFDPYYFRTRRLSRQSDTYAFGVVLLEVLCGRSVLHGRPEEDEYCLTLWARSIIRSGEFNQLVAPHLMGDISAHSLNVFVGVAEMCLHEEPKKRPTMAQVVLQLEYALELEERINFLMPDQETQVADGVSSTDDETKSLISIEQVTIIYADGEAESKLANSETSDSNKDERELKTNRPLRLWPWDAIRNRAKPPKQKESVSKTLSEFHEAVINLKKFDFTIIAAATNQFSSSNKVGKGVCGSIYKAVLPTGQVLAVKRLSSITKRGLRELKNEILLLSNIRHCNIIQLLGYCILGEEPMLVYEFMANQSLDFVVHDEIQSRLLHWDLRFKIIMGLARGIMYLHQDSGMEIIHRDIKPSNILLDTYMNPKICDFSFAITFETDQYVVEAGQAGTFGYLAPEVITCKKVSAMSDVYSFGVVVLETLSGRRIVSYGQNDFDPNLLSYARKLWNEGKALDLVDGLLDGSFSAEEALRCIQIGLMCIQKQPHDRPTMRSVLKMLRGENLPLGQHEKVPESFCEVNEAEGSGSSMPHLVIDRAPTFGYHSTMQADLSSSHSSSSSSFAPGSS